MLVIGDRELQFRVNVRPTNSGVAQENYGLISRFVSHTAATAGRDTGRRTHFSNFAG